MDGFVTGLIFDFSVDANGTFPEEPAGEDSAEEPAARDVLDVVLVFNKPR